MKTVMYAAALTGLTGLAAPAHAQSCDRACLRSTLDQYLAAVVKHDPSAAPLATAYRHTENAISKMPRDGVWKSVTGLGKVQRKYFDPVSGQAAYYGLVDEGSSSALVTRRPGRFPRSLSG